MRRPVRRARLAVLTLTGVLLTLVPASPASAHVEKESGPFRVTLGWAVEPALSGSQNSVEAAVSDSSGKPVAARDAKLEVEVSFGGAAVTRPLVPGDEPGVFDALIVPTRPGIYAFHVSGTVRGRILDASATCSERTFDCVTESAELQFPARDPSNAELAQRVARELPRAEGTADDADGARSLALVALAVALLALAAAVTLGLRGRRKLG